MGRLGGVWSQVRILSPRLLKSASWMFNLLADFLLILFEYFCRPKKVKR